jgi:hypothetical protein
MERNDGTDTAAFKFATVPRPAKDDAAANASFNIVDGERDRNGGDLAQLHDGRVPREEDAPAQNFFFAQNSNGGRIRIDLGRAITIKEINSYSWHAGTRGPQVYTLFASLGNEDRFQGEPKKGTDPETCGWTRITNVDTRAGHEPGGQYGVSISDSSGALGTFRYLLFDVARTEDKDPFGNTFYSEIDVIDRAAPSVARIDENAKPVTKAFATADGKYHFTIDATVAPDLMDWADRELRPVVKEWYPKLVDMLPSEGYQAATNIVLLFRDNMGGTPASAAGSRINLNAGWFRRNLKGEARGSVVHEMVHVVQNYGRARRMNPNATRTPGWLVEGIPDYIRWFLYEPQTKGAEITQRNLARARYDASYRVTGNFLNWVTQSYAKELVQKLNAAAREGKYTEELWSQITGKSLQALGEEWKQANERRLAPKAEAPAKTGGGQ